MKIGKNAILNRANQASIRNTAFKLYTQQCD